MTILNFWKSIYYTYRSVICRNTICIVHLPEVDTVMCCCTFTHCYLSSIYWVAYKCQTRYWSRLIKNWTLMLENQELFIKFILMEWFSLHFTYWPTWLVELGKQKNCAFIETSYCKISLFLFYLTELNIIQCEKCLSVLKSGKPRCQI